MVILTRLVNNLHAECEADGSWDIGQFKYNYICMLFYRQLKQSRKAWSLTQNKPKISEGHMETNDKVATHLHNYTCEQFALVGSHSCCEHVHFPNIGSQLY